MNIEGWDARYRSGERASEDWHAAPTPLVVRIASALSPGRALDLACGSGRNSLWLAARGWNVTAFDGAPAAIAMLCHSARERNLSISASVQDLESPDLRIEPGAWDLVLDCYYLQRSLFPLIREAVRPGGAAVCIVHLTAFGEQTSYKHAAPGELRSLFDGWEILHDYEGAPRDEAHKRAVAEIVARRPLNGGTGNR